MTFLNSVKNALINEGKSEIDAELFIQDLISLANTVQYEAIQMEKDRESAFMAQCHKPLITQDGVTGDVPNCPEN